MSFLSFIVWCIVIVSSIASFISLIWFIASEFKEHWK
jgi:hypothetical protein